MSAHHAAQKPYLSVCKAPLTVHNIQKQEAMLVVVAVTVAAVIVVIMLIVTKVLVVTVRKM